MNLLAATFALVFLRAWQQQNVIHRHFLMAACTSYAMAIGEVALFLGIVATGWNAVLWVGTGGAMGVTASMYLHARLMRRKTKPISL
jgi:hypothetical protein